MYIKVLSSKGYENEDSNLGDCLIIDTSKEVVVYDCGCEEHAIRVLDYMEEKGYNQVRVVLSHNDADHFNGIEYLHENTTLVALHTVLLLKYKSELLDEIGDDRKTRESLEKQILKLYENIAKFSNQDVLENVYDDSHEFVSIVDGVEVVGPDFDYMIEAAAKGLNTTEGDTIDGETVVNATSVQLLIDLDGEKVLLTGDSSFESIKDNLDGATTIQLPHHGKLAIAEKVFEELSGQNDVVYVVSDNTGDSNGGSDDLMKKKGHIIKNTKSDGDIELTLKKVEASGAYTGSYGTRDKT